MTKRREMYLMKEAINESKKRTAVCIVITAAVIALSLIFIAFTKLGSNGRIAYVYSDGELIETIDLDRVTSPYTFTVSHNGGENLIEVRHGEIGVISATCPDKICVDRGHIKDSSLPIVCLPNKLVVQIGKNSDSDVPDAVAQ